jgi:serine/threonine protein phosphatase PrpC
MVPDREILAVFTNSGKAEQHCQALLDKALDAGGKDNITVVVAHYSLPPAKAGSDHRH